MSNIWSTLSQINVNEHVKTKGGYSYLAWTWAWATVKENYPEATYTLLDDIIYPDGTMEVRVEVGIEEQFNTMWLPVLDFKNKAIANPNAFDVNSARMRCLVKCLAMFGLGHYIYAGESTPQEVKESATDEQWETLVSLLATKNHWGLRQFTAEMGGVMDELFNMAPKGQKTRFKDEVRELYAVANGYIKAAVEAIQIELGDNNASGLKEVLDELEEAEKAFVWAALSEVEKHGIKLLLEKV